MDEEQRGAKQRGHTPLHEYKVMPHLQEDEVRVSPLYVQLPPVLDDGASEAQIDEAQKPVLLDEVSARSEERVNEERSDDLDLSTAFFANCCRSPI